MSIFNPNPNPNPHPNSDPKDQDRATHRFFFTYSGAPRAISGQPCRGGWTEVFFKTPSSVLTSLVADSWMVCATEREFQLLSQSEPSSVLKAFDAAGAPATVPSNDNNLENLYMAAVAIFRSIHPDRPGHEGIVNCAGIYPEEEFKRTAMWEDPSGNFGRRCVEKIVYTDEIVVTRCRL